MIYTRNFSLAEAVIATDYTFVANRFDNFLDALQFILQRRELSVPIDLDDLLAKHGQIALIWGLDDVAAIRPDLTEAQGMDVLTHVREQHDCEFGVTWQTLESAAEALFGDAPETSGDGDQS
jgi:hypothetical protein